MTNDSYRHHFSESGFFSKIKLLTGTLQEYALLLYLVMSEKGTPHGIRLVIVAALGYLICPFDAIPDFLPFGYTDDLAALAALVASLDGCITAEMRQKARKQLS